ncbi:MAG: FHA domain-containing protein [Deltaproteobacteria bacterium]|nr:FHA domain-containing protein [Deltaproteobacteria bacterium]
MSAPKQITVLFNGKKQGVFLLDTPEAFIGRGRSAHIALDDNPIVSRKHAVLRSEGDGHVLQDLGGANGTFINDERVSATRLKEGDRITLGKHTLRYERGTPEALSLKAAAARAAGTAAVAAATSQMTAQAEPQALGPKAAPWERPKPRRAPPAAVAGGLGSAMGTSEKTMAASKDELEALVEQMKIKAGPHLSVPFEGQMKLMSISPMTTTRIGYGDTCQVRLPGAVWFSKVAATLTLRKGKWWLENHQPFWRSVTVAGGPLKKKRKLTKETVITIDKVKIRFSPGEAP